MFSCSHLLNSLLKFLLEVSKNLKEEEHLLVLNRTVAMDRDRSRGGLTLPPPTFWCQKKILNKERNKNFKKVGKFISQ